MARHYKMEQKETKKCPYCGKEILAVAKKCRFCGQWLEESPKPAEQIANKIKAKPKNKLAVLIAVTAAITLIIIIGFISLQGNSKTYLKDLQTKTETKHDFLGDENIDYYVTSNGDKFEGEAWESNDIESIYMQGGIPVMVNFYYPNGRLATSTEAWAIDGNTSHGACFDLDGNEISFEQFKSEYISKYGNKLKNKEYLIGF